MRLIVMAAMFVVLGEASKEVYLQKGMSDMFWFQLTLHPADKKADIEFLLNTGFSRIKEYPKLFLITGMDYSFDEKSKVLRFLDRPSAQQLAQIDAMNAVFASFGKMDVPFEAQLDGETIYARIMKLEVGLEKTEEAVDMTKLLEKLKAAGPSKTTPPTEAVAQDTPTPGAPTNGVGVDLATHVFTAAVMMIALSL